MTRQMKRAAIVKLYVEGRSMREVGELFNITAQAVHKHLLEAGIARRDRNEGRRRDDA